MLRLLPGTFFIALTFLVVSAAFCGIGLMIRRAFGLIEIELDDVFTAFWMGFAAVVLFLLIWNFFLPVRGSALAVVLSAGGAGVVLARASLRRLAAADRPTGWVRVLAVVVVVLLWIANISTGEMTNWDSALYHMQGVKWAHEYPAVPGLANLFGPLGFNNASFLYDAMLGSWMWEGKGWHLSNGLLMLGLVVPIIVAGARFLRHEKRRSPADLFALLILATVVDRIMSHSSSYTTDVSLAAVRLFSLVLWYRLLLRERSDEHTNAYTIVCLVTFAAVSVALKMNAAVFSVLMVGTVVTQWLVQNPRGAFRARTAAWCAMIGLAFGGAWLARGIVLSGYPVFPTPTLGVAVDWRAPIEHAQAEFDYILHSAHNTVSNLPYVSGAETGMRPWFGNWVRHLTDDPYYVLLPVIILLALTPVVISARQQAMQDDRAAVRDVWWMLLPISFAFASWFLVAPEPRYAAPRFWTLVAIAGAQAFALRRRAITPTGARRIVVAAVVMGLSPMLVKPVLLWRSGRSPDGLVRTIAKANLRVPPRGEWFHPLPAPPKLTPFVTTSGLTLYQPEQRCWDARLLCTPNPAPNLRLRVPGHIENGFAVDGPWKMQDWPYKWRKTFLPAWRLGRARASGSRS